MKKGYLKVFIMVFALTLGIGLTEAQAVPDLIVTDLRVQDLTAAGIKIFITDTTKNVGTDSLANRATITRYYLSTSPAIGDSIATLGDRYVPELGLNESNIGSNYVKIPGATAPGNYYIIAKADALNYVPESKEGNNKRVAMIQIVSTVSTNLPDLVINLLTPPATAAPGELIYVSNRTKNNGPGAALASVTSLYLSSDCTIGPGDVLLRTRDVPALPAGISNTRNTPVKIPPETTEGLYKIIAEADAFNINNEGANEGNNTLCADITIASP